MNHSDTYPGACFCGAVQFVLTGQPLAMGFCHCESCRHWSAGPVNAFTLWRPDAFEVTRGADQIGSYHKTAASLRKWCVRCGGHLYTEHPGLGVIDVYAAVIPQLRFEPHLHVHYQETVLRIVDGHPKMQDLPADMGGSGTELPE
jgi:hypothetical protein